MNRKAIRGALAFLGLAMVAGVSMAGTAPTTTNVVAIGAGSHEGNGVAVDADGNIYLTGQHQTSRYDSSTATRYSELGGVEYVVNNYTDFFLMKLDADLNVLWTRVGGSARYDYGTAVRVAANGDAVVTAAFQEDFDLGGQTLTNSNTSSYFRTDSFVARYDPSGNLLWIQTANGPDGNVTIDDVEIDDEGSIYVAGDMYGIATFGGTAIGQNNQTKVFLAKYSGAGQFQWARVVESSSDAGTAALAIDANGNVIVGGMLYSGDRGVFLASYDSLGNQDWLTRFDTGNREELSDLAVDEAGNIWFSGRFSGSTFDLGNGVALTNSGSFFNGYVAMVDSNRVAQWIVPAGSRGYEFERDAAGDLIVAGYHQAPYLGLSDQLLADGQGGTDAYVGSLSSAGAFGWSLPWATGSGELCRAIAVGPDESIVVAGEGNTALFGPTFRGRVFLAKLGSGVPQVQRPALGISIENGEVEVSWPETDGFYVLEATPALDVEFSEVSAVAVEGKTNTFRIAATNETLFIRLTEIILVE